MQTTLPFAVLGCAGLLAAQQVLVAQQGRLVVPPEYAAAEAPGSTAAAIAARQEPANNKPLLGVTDSSPKHSRGGRLAYRPIEAA